MQDVSDGSLNKWKSTLNDRPRKMASKEGCDKICDAAATNIKGFPKSVTFTDACQGLLKVISYLEAHKNLGDDYIPLLWQIFQQICDHIQVDLFSTKYGQFACGENCFHFSTDSSKGLVNKCDMPQEQTTESVDGVSEIKTEHVEPEYDKAMLGTQTDLTIVSCRLDYANKLSYGSTGTLELSTVSSLQRRHPCSGCGKQFNMLIELLKHMTSHALNTELSDNKQKQTEKMENHQQHERSLWKTSQQSIISDFEQISHFYRSNNVGNGSNSLLRGDDSPKKFTNMVNKKTPDRRKSNTIKESCISEMDQETKVDDGNMKQLMLMKAVDKQMYKCEICGRNWDNYRNYHQHLCMHSGNKPFKCSICDKSFCSSSALNKHGTVHTGEKPYVCSVCGKALTQAAGLAMHMRLHTGERPYKCSVCDKDFSQSQHLKEHMHLHSGERRHKCHLCGKDFAQTPSLKEHLRIHTGEKPYHCTTCGKSFLRSGELIKHVRVHTGEKPYKCHLCGKCFTQKGNMTKHRLTHVKKADQEQDMCGK